MVMDLILLTIVIVSAICYAKIGFTKSVLSSFHWLISLAIGLFFCDDVKRMLMKTGMADGMSNDLEEKFQDAVMGSSAVESTPELFRDWTGSATNVIAREAAEGITSIVLSIVTFLILMIAVRLVLFILTRFFSKDYHSGAIGKIDGTLGLLLGLILGVVYMFIFLAVLVLVTGWLAPDTASTIKASLDSSFFAGSLYENNPILIAIHSFFNN